MKSRLAENIRIYRRQRRLTQEKLAEALGVTVGAVSKWEIGTSSPELHTLMGLADYFETSMDVLCGHELEDGGLSAALRKITAYTETRDFDSCLFDAEKYIAKFPNSFELVYNYAQLCFVAGVDRQDKDLLKKSLELFNRAHELLDQNRNERITSYSLNSNIAHVYLELGRTDIALERFKECNISGVNNEIIGNIYSTFLGNSEFATPYLSEALASIVVKLFYICAGYTNIFDRKRDYRSMLDVSLWLHRFYDELRPTGVVSYIDRLDTVLLACCAESYMYLDNTYMAQDLLNTAAEIAARYDAAPSHSFAGLRFFAKDQKVALYDDVGGTAVSGIISLIEGCRDEAVREKLRALWDKVRVAHGL